MCYGAYIGWGVWYLIGYPGILYGSINRTRRTKHGGYTLGGFLMSLAVPADRSRSTIAALDLLSQI